MKEVKKGIFYDINLEEDSLEKEKDENLSNKKNFGIEDLSEKGDDENIPHNNSLEVVWTEVEKDNEGNFPLKNNLDGSLEKKKDKNIYHEKNLAENMSAKKHEKNSHLESNFEVEDSSKKEKGDEEDSFDKCKKESIYFENSLEVDVSVKGDEKNIHDEHYLEIENSSENEGTIHCANNLGEEDVSKKEKDDEDFENYLEVDEVSTEKVNEEIIRYENNLEIDSTENKNENENIDHENDLEDLSRKNNEKNIHHENNLEIDVIFENKATIHHNNNLEDLFEKEKDEKNIHYENFVFKEGYVINQQENEENIHNECDLVETSSEKENIHHANYLKIEVSKNEKDYKDFENYLEVDEDSTEKVYEEIICYENNLEIDSTEKKNENENIDHENDLEDLSGKKNEENIHYENSLEIEYISENKAALHHKDNLENLFEKEKGDQNNINHENFIFEEGYSIKQPENVHNGCDLVETSFKKENIHHANNLKIDVSKKEKGYKDLENYMEVAEDASENVNEENIYFENNLEVGSIEKETENENIDYKNVLENLSDKKNEENIHYENNLVGSTEKENKNENIDHKNDLENLSGKKNEENIHYEFSLEIEYTSENKAALHHKDNLRNLFEKEKRNKKNINHENFRFEEGYSINQQENEEYIHNECDFLGASFEKENIYHENSLEIEDSPEEGKNVEVFPRKFCDSVGMCVPLSNKKNNFIFVNNSDIKTSTFEISNDKIINNSIEKFDVVSTLLTSSQSKMESDTNIYKQVIFAKMGLDQITVEDDTTLIQMDAVAVQPMPLQVKSIHLLYSDGSKDSIHPLKSEIALEKDASNYYDKNVSKNLSPNKCLSETLNLAASSVVMNSDELPMDSYVSLSERHIKNVNRPKHSLPSSPKQSYIDTETNNNKPEVPSQVYQIVEQKRIALSQTDTFSLNRVLSTLDKLSVDIDGNLNSFNEHIKTFKPEVISEKKEPINKSNKLSPVNNLSKYLDSTYPSVVTKEKSLLISNCVSLKESCFEAETLNKSSFVENNIEDFKILPQKILDTLEERRLDKKFNERAIMVKKNVTDCSQHLGSKILREVSSNNELICNQNSNSIKCVSTAKISINTCLEACSINKSDVTGVNECANPMENIIVAKNLITTPYKILTDTMQDYIENNNDACLGNLKIVSITSGESCSRNLEPNMFKEDHENPDEENMSSTVSNIIENLYSSNYSHLVLQENDVESEEKHRITTNHEVNEITPNLTFAIKATKHLCKKIINLDEMDLDTDEKLAKCSSSISKRKLFNTDFEDGTVLKRPRKSLDPIKLKQEKFEGNYVYEEMNVAEVKQEVSEKESYIEQDLSCKARSKLLSSSYVTKKQKQEPKISSPKIWLKSLCNKKKKRLKHLKNALKSKIHYIALPECLRKIAESCNSSLIVQRERVNNDAENEEDKNVMVMCLVFDTTVLDWAFSNTLLSIKETNATNIVQKNDGKCSFIFPPVDTPRDSYYCVNLGGYFPFSMPSQTSCDFSEETLSLSYPLEQLTKICPSASGVRDAHYKDKEVQMKTIQFAKEPLEFAFNNTLLSSIEDSPILMCTLELPVSHKVWPDVPKSLLLPNFNVDYSFPFTCSDKQRQYENILFFPFEAQIPLKLMESQLIRDITDDMQREMDSERNSLVRLLGLASYYKYLSLQKFVSTNPQLSVALAAIVSSFKPLIISQANNFGMKIEEARLVTLEGIYSKDESVLPCLIRGPVNASNCNLFSHSGINKLKRSVAKNSFNILKKKWS